MTNTLRVRAASPSPAPTGPNAPDEYLARLVKLIPAEVIALYLTVKGTFDGKLEPLATWGVVCLLLVILVRAVATKSGRAEAGIRSVQLLAVTAATVSFVLWVLASGNPIGWGRNWFAWLSYPSAVAGVWTFLIPYFYKGDPQ